MRWIVAFLLIASTAWADPSTLPNWTRHPDAPAATGETYELTHDQLNLIKDTLIAHEAAIDTLETTTETDPVVGAITGVPIADGAGNISAADSTDIGALFTGDEDYLLADGSTGPGGAINWAADRSYTADISGVVHGGVFYVCILTHTSAAADEPGVGVNEATYWEAYSNVTVDGTPTAGQLVVWDDANTISGTNAVSSFTHQRTMTATALNTFAIGEVGFLAAAGTVTKAQADAESTVKNLLVMAKEAVAADASGLFVLYGEVTVTGHLHAVGSPLFVSETTAGAITSTAPALSDEYVRVIGHPLTANLILFDPSPDWIKVYVEP